MACETMRAPQQTLAERIAEVRAVLGLVDRGLLKRKIKPVVGKNGAITFTGLAAEDRRSVSDACIYRRIMATGSSLAKAEIARAEQIAGRGVDRKQLTAGVHSHDGGATWDGRH